MEMQSVGSLFHWKLLLEDIGTKVDLLAGDHLLMQYAKAKMGLGM